MDGLNNSSTHGSYGNKSKTVRRFAPLKLPRTPHLCRVALLQRVDLLLVSAQRVNDPLPLAVQGGHSFREALPIDL